MILDCGGNKKYKYKFYAFCANLVFTLGGVNRCGPQPNSRLLLNYGFVDEDNPYDRIALEVII